MSRGLHIQSLSAGYRNRPVLEGVTLDPFPGEALTALVGPNAAGKSTLLKAVAGLVDGRGSIRLEGREILDLSSADRARHVAFMPQSLPQQVSLSVLEGTLSALRASALDAAPRGAEARARAIHALERVGISHLALESLNRLSGGQRQLAGLAQALAREPRLLLLDEPTSALDLLHQAVVMGLARELTEDGHVVVVVLHDVNLALRWADHLVVMAEGDVAAQGLPVETLTDQVLADVWRVEGRVERAGEGAPHVVVDGPL